MAILTNSNHQHNGMEGTKKKLFFQFQVSVGVSTGSHETEH